MNSEEKPSCFYCQMISKHETSYPVRKGLYTYEGDAYRCFWHAQFLCSVCKKYQHFSWLYWCHCSKNLICGNCNSPTMKPVQFWGKTYSYHFFCEECDDYHDDLLYNEFQGTHPIQLGHDLNPSSIIKKKDHDTFWKPDSFQTGENLTLQEALKIPNQVKSIRLKRADVNFHSDLIKESELRQDQIQMQWEKNSANWIEYHEQKSPNDRGDINRQLIIDPALWELIGDPSGLIILDAGCGNGYLSRELARKGADVVGVDISSKFIAYCKKKEREELLGCKFLHSSLDDMDSLTSNSFDLVVSNIVFIDVLDYKKSFKEISRVIKPKGRFLWSNVHPIFGRATNEFYRLPHDTPRNEERKYVLVDRYFDSGARLISWGNLQPLWQFDRTLAEYSKALKDTGFVIREIIEPKPDEELLRKYPKVLAFDADRIPFFIIFDCINLA